MEKKLQFRRYSQHLKHYQQGEQVQDKKTNHKKHRRRYQRNTIMWNIEELTEGVENNDEISINESNTLNQMEEKESKKTCNKSNRINLLQPVNINLIQTHIPYQEKEKDEGEKNCMRKIFNKL